MKYLISVIFVIIIGLLVYGFYLKSNGNMDGEIIVGIGVLAIAFVLMPLFIYHRYKDKNMADFRLDKWFEKLKENEKKNN
ncbi:hypothetical protein [Lutibacter sp.]